MWPAVCTILTRYATAWTYLVAATAGQVFYELLPRGDRGELVAWASTNVHNLVHDPLGCLVASAFLPSGNSPTWPLLTALALFGATHVLGNWRTALVCATGHVAGTYVSEGIVDYRILHGTLPAADRYIVDVGPSYVVVAALVVALLFGGWLIRAAAALDLALLVFAGQILAGLSKLHVAAVGHVTSMTTAALLGGWLGWRQRRGQPADLAPRTEAGPVT